MLAVAYGVRPDEPDLFDEEVRAVRSEGIDLELKKTAEYLTEDTAGLAEGADAVIIVAACRITEEIARKLKACGVKYVLTRSTGYDQIGKDAIQKYGIRAANVPVYSKNAVPEYTVFLMLALVRHARKMADKFESRDFTLSGIRGRELGSMTLGLFGTGKIGMQTAKILHAMGCRILACDPYEKEEARQYVTYTDRNTIFHSADLIFFHCVLTDENRGMINRESIARMKDGVYIVNTARGGLIDFTAVLDGLKSGKIAGFATDVYDNEASFIRKDLRGQEIGDPVLKELLSRDDVILTPHVAFFTETSVRNLIRTTLQNLISFETSGTCVNEVYKA